MELDPPSSATSTRASHPPARSRRANLLLLAAGLIAALSLGEIVLRIAGFRYELRLHMIESTAPNSEAVRGFRIDRDLAWVPVNYAQTLQQAEADPPRLIFLGDSCTQFGTFDRYFETDFATVHSGAQVRTANFGCAGYTTHQGSSQLRRDVVPLHPRIVTLYYGWNDHWLSIGVDDAEVSRLNASPLFRFNRLRLVQLLNKTWVTLRLKVHGSRPVRVPLDPFRDNLRQMVHVARDAGIVPVLVTPPTSHQVGREPEYLALRWIANLADLVPLHQRYVQAVRDVANEEDVPLCDLAADFDTLSPKLVREVYFQSDGIHLTDEGSRAVAAELLASFDSNGLSKRLMEE